MKFRDRFDAGVQLARLLSKYSARPDAVVLALPRGGVPVAFEVASRLRLPLYPFIVRKLGVPGQEELAMGAVASGNIVVKNDDVINYAAINEPQFKAVLAAEIREMERRERLYSGGRPLPDLQDKICIIVDDGIATGASMAAAVQAVYSQYPQKVVVASPVAAYETRHWLSLRCDEIVTVGAPREFSAVGAWYERFDQTPDEEVTRLLTASDTRPNH